MRIEQMICPNCQSDNFKDDNENYTCLYCLSKFSKKQIDSKMFVDLFLANNERNLANFDKAKSIYKKIIEENPNEDLSDVYWGQFLCEQRVVFEEDGKGEKFPSFYRINENESESVEESPCFNKALVYALKHNRSRIAPFNDLAEKIENARKMYLDIKKTTEPFDIFICFKNTDENGNHTKDRELAMDIYNEFSGKYNIFFSEKTLKNIKSSYREYEPNIYYGLYTAKIMLLICSKREYLESKWLKNEWSRFTSVGKQGDEGKVIIPIFTDGFKPEDLPDKLWHCQGIFDDRKFVNTLETTLKNIIHPIDRLEELKKEQELKLLKQKDEINKEREKYRKEQEDKINEQAKKFAEIEKIMQDQQSKQDNLKNFAIDDLIKERELLEEERVRKEREKKEKIERERLEKERKRKERYQKYMDNNPIISSDNDRKITFGNFVQDGKTPEPITWRIIESKGNRYKIMSDKILYATHFYKNNPNDKNLMGNTFELSDLRKWLNGYFYNSAFNAEQKTHIVSSLDTFVLDKVTIPTMYDIYILFDHERPKKNTKYAESLNSYSCPLYSKREIGQYWLKHEDTDYPKPQRNFAFIVSFNGSFGEASVEDNRIGVVPVITVEVNEFEEDDE